ncbi:MAG: hypothetical protein WBF33_09310 [Candidatus Nitrosopolaris sp.]
MLNVSLWEQGIRTIPCSLQGTNRYDFKAARGLCKWFKTRAEQAGMLPLHVETLMDHSMGISDFYGRPKELQLLEDYLKAVDNLTINSEMRSKEVLDNQQALARELEQYKRERQEIKVQLEQSKQEMREARTLIEATKRDILEDWDREAKVLGARFKQQLADQMARTGDSIKTIARRAIANHDPAEDHVVDLSKLSPIHKEIVKNKIGYADLTERLKEVANDRR